MQGLKHHGDSARPISTEETAELFRCLTSHPRLVLAVSGGGDSLALMHLAARWTASMPDAPALHVLSVDHGLYPDSAAVAATVHRQARALGLPCTVLRWRGEKPETGIEEAARMARYALLGGWCRQHDAALVSAHTLQDQAETFLMRLARGAGVDGLSAMPRQGTVPGIHPPVPLLRPLLEVPRARLRASLRAWGIDWHEDPANEDERFERTRLRHLLPLLREIGLTPEAVGTSARRLWRARTALQEQARAFLCRHARMYPPGWATLPRPAVEALPEELRLRALALLLGHVGGNGMPLRDMAALERLLHWLAHEPGRARTLAGARIVRRQRQIIIGREPGRPPGPWSLHEVPTTITWDNRFHVTLRQRAGAQWRLEMLAGALQHARLPDAAPARPKSTPAFAWQAQPAIVDADTIIALPAIGWRVADAILPAIELELLPPPWLTGETGNEHC